MNLGRSCMHRSPVRRLFITSTASTGSFRGRDQPFWIRVRIYWTVKYRIWLTLLVTTSNFLKRLAPDGSVRFVRPSVHHLFITLMPLGRRRLCGILLPDMARTARYRRYCPPVNHG